MSMRNYPMCDTVFIISEELCAYLIRAELEHFPEAVQDKETAEALKLTDVEFVKKAKEGTLPEVFTDFSTLIDLNDGGEIRNLTRLSNFEGTAETIKEVVDTTSKSVDITYSDDDRAAYVMLEKEASLFRPAYRDPEEIIDEVRSSLADFGQYIPDNFEFAPWICDIKGDFYE